MIIYLHCFRLNPPAAKIHATNGLVGTIIHGGSFFITSPNCLQIFLPSFGGMHKVFLQSDGLYAEDDPIQWPQPFNRFYSHYTAIPSHASLPEHPIMWWKPSPLHFTSSTSPICGLGKLAPPKLAELQTLVSTLLQHVDSHLSLTPSAAVLPISGPMVKMMEHGLLCLESVVTAYHQMAAGVQDVQRSWLEVVVMLDYMQIYKPHMDSPEYVIPPTQPANMIGVFTNEIQVAQDCFIAGLPVWLIWPVTEFIDVSIQQIVLLVLPNELLIVEPLSNSDSYIYEGSSNSCEKFDAILQVARHSFCSPNPFNLDAVGPLTSSHPTIQLTTSIANTRSANPGAGSSHQHDARRGAQQHGG